MTRRTGMTRRTEREKINEAIWDRSPLRLSHILQREGAAKYIGINHLLYAAQTLDEAMLQILSRTLGQNKAKSLVSEHLKDYLLRNIRGEDEEPPKDLMRLLDFLKRNNIITTAYIVKVIRIKNIPFLQCFLNDPEGIEKLISQEQIKVVWQEALATQDLRILGALIPHLGSRVKNLMSNDQMEAVWQQILATQNSVVLKTLISALGEKAEEMISQERLEAAWEQASMVNNFRLPMTLISALGEKAEEMTSQEQQMSVLRWIIERELVFELKGFLSCLGMKKVRENPWCVTFAIQKASGEHPLFNRLFDLLAADVGSLEEAAKEILTETNMKLVAQEKLAIFYYLSRMAPRALEAAITEQYLSEVMQNGDYSTLLTLLKHCTRSMRNSFLKDLCSEASDEKDEEMKSSIRSKLLKHSVESDETDMVRFLLATLDKRARITITPETLDLAKQNGTSSNFEILGLLLKALVKQPKSWLENSANSNSDAWPTYDAWSTYRDLLTALAEGNAEAMFTEAVKIACCADDYSFFYLFKNQQKHAITPKHLILAINSYNFGALEILLNASSGPIEGIITDDVLTNIVDLEVSRCRASEFPAAPEPIFLNLVSSYFKFHDPSSLGNKITSNHLATACACGNAFWLVSALLQKLSPEQTKEMITFELIEAATSSSSSFFPIQSLLQSSLTKNSTASFGGGLFGQRTLAPDSRVEEDPVVQQAASLAGGGH